MPHPDYWRGRADLLRSMASHAADEHERETLEKAAAGYEKLAGETEAAMTRNIRQQLTGS